MEWEYVRSLAGAIYRWQFWQITHLFAASEDKLTNVWISFQKAHPSATKTCGSWRMPTNGQTIIFISSVGVIHCLLIFKRQKRQSSLSVWMARTRCHVSRFLIIPNSRNFKAVVLHPLSGRDKQSSNYQKNIVTKGKKSKLDTTISERWYKLLLQRTTTSQGSAKYNCFFTHYIVTKWRADHFDNASLLMIT